MSRAHRGVAAVAAAAPVADYDVVLTGASFCVPCSDSEDGDAGPCPPPLFIEQEYVPEAKPKASEAPIREEGVDDGFFDAFTFQAPDRDDAWKDTYLAEYDVAECQDEEPYDYNQWLTEFLANPVHDEVHDAVSKPSSEDEPEVAAPKCEMDSE